MSFRPFISSLTLQVGGPESTFPSTDGQPGLVARSSGSLRACRARQDTGGREKSEPFAEPEGRCSSVGPARTSSDQ